MNPLKIFSLLFMVQLLMAFQLSGAEENAIYNHELHQKNKKIFSTIIQEVLRLCPSKSPDQQASYLSTHIAHISQEILRRGFDLSAYQFEQLPESNYLAFNFASLWEGKTGSSATIPLTFFVFIWPSETLAKKYDQPAPGTHEDPKNAFYASNIHSHPLSCALTVMKQTIDQETYQVVRDHPTVVVKKVKNETFKVGNVVVDDQSQPFIHRMVCRHPKARASVTLHAYGAPTAAEVKATFVEGRKNHAYRYVLENNKIRETVW